MSNLSHSQQKKKEVLYCKDPEKKSALGNKINCVFNCYFFIFT